MDPWLSFMVVAAGGMIVPGPDTLVVLRTALGSGAAAGAWAAAGSAAGNLVWGTASVLGATALLTASAGAFTALKVAGAAYLVLLGVQALRAARRGDGFGAAEADERRAGAGAAFRRGLASDLLNVKVGLFWSALAPQFLTPGAPALLPAAMVAGMGAMVFAWLTAYALAAARLSATLSRPRCSRALNGVAGVAFVALATGLLASAG